MYGTQRDRSPDFATDVPKPSRLAAVVCGMRRQRRLQLRGSSGISPLSRASRCHLQRRKLQWPPTDYFEERPTALRLSQRSRNAQDGHLAGLLTYASANSSAFPEFPVALCSALSDYSCGAVAEFHRASQKPDGKSYNEGDGFGQEEGLRYLVIWYLALSQISTTNGPKLRAETGCLRYFLHLTSCPFPRLVAA